MRIIYKKIFLINFQKWFQNSQREELGEVLHEVDFKQLKIENKQFMTKIDEKNNEMIKLKKIVGSVTQTLNYRKVTITPLFRIQMYSFRVIKM